MPPCLSRPSHSPQLTLLYLAAELSLHNVGPLTALLQLEQLRLADKNSGPPAAQLVLPSPAVHWPRLRAYHIDRQSGSWQVCAAAVGRCNGLPASCPLAQPLQLTANCQLPLGPVCANSDATTVSSQMKNCQIRFNALVNDISAPPRCTGAG